MIKTETTIRVRYAETDQMGFVYYGIYAQYYEVGRVEAMRSFGLSYKEVESRGILLPVINLSIQYKKAALYDDEVRIVTMIKQIPTARFVFEHECYNQKNELLNTGSVTLVFVDKEKNKPILAPKWFLDEFNKMFNR